MLGLCEDFSTVAFSHFLKKKKKTAFLKATWKPKEWKLSLKNGADAVTAQGHEEACYRAPMLLQNRWKGMLFLLVEKNEAKDCRQKQNIFLHIKSMISEKKAHTL